MSCSNINNKNRPFRIAEFLRTSKFETRNSRNFRMQKEHKLST